MLQSFLFKLKDHRRKQGQRYQLGHILLFSILAILSGAKSYRQVQYFIVRHYSELDELCHLNWKRLPAYSSIRAIIQGTSGSELEQSFRQYSQQLMAQETDKRLISCDGKTLRGSFDHFQDQQAVQILSAFVRESQIILAHEELADKGQDISAAQRLLETLGVSGYIFTFDALHCQKNAPPSERGWK